MRALRGQAYRADLGNGPKPWVVLSNNQCNRTLDTVLAARITTTSKNSHVPTVVAFAAADPLVGFVLVDNIVQLYDDEIGENLGALSTATMNRICASPSRSSLRIRDTHPDRPPTARTY